MVPYRSRIRRANELYTCLNKCCPAFYTLVPSAVVELVTCISLYTILSVCTIPVVRSYHHQNKMADDDYDPNQDDDVASDHLDDEAPGPSKRKVTAAGAGKGDVSQAIPRSRKADSIGRKSSMGRCL
jgi:hypothetical protein